MKKGIYYSKKDVRTIRLGYFLRYGSIVIVLLLPIIIGAICGLFGAEPDMQRFVALLSFGISLLGIGTYNVIGAALEFKHVLVSLQLGGIMPDINPRRGWTGKEKKECIIAGVIFIILGLAAIIVFCLTHFGIIK